MIYDEQIEELQREMSELRARRDEYGTLSREAEEALNSSTDIPQKRTWCKNGQKWD